MTKQALRRAWWQVHKWIGLALMILLVPLGLSGIVLAWDTSIDHRLNPQRYAVHGQATLAPSAYAAAAQARLGPGEHLSQLRLPQGEGPVVVNATGRQPRGRKGRPPRVTVWLDPGTARVLDVSHGDSGLIRLAHNFHGGLFLPMPAGRALVGVLGVAMFLMAMSGVWLWWPQVGRWTKGLRWRRGDRRLDTNLHHRVGIWIAPLLAAQAFTGVWIASPQMAAAVGLSSSRGGPPQGRFGGAPTAAPRMSPDQAVAAAGVQRASAIDWPSGRDAQWRISAPGGDWTVDDDSGAASRAPPRGGGIAMTFRHYHDGELLGPAWRVLLILLGLTPTLFAITGLTMWLRGRRWRAQERQRRPASRDPVAAE